jgi:hypothetical protein
MHSLEIISVTLLSHFFTKIIDNRKQTYIHTNDKSVWDLGFKPLSYCGTIAQRESTSLTSKGSLVQSQLVPPFFNKKNYLNSFGQYFYLFFYNKYID